MGDNEAPSNSFIFDTAMNRWLEVNELETQLNLETTELPISTHPPTTPPPSGSLLLYDRSVTRNYKQDGYEWVRRRNTLTGYEDHVKRRVRGRFRVGGCYARCANIPTLHRRAYHLIHPETGRALTPPSNRANNGSQPSLVLVQYLDTELADNRPSQLTSDDDDMYILSVAFLLKETEDNDGQQ